jgi:hypothetical protein
MAPPHLRRAWKLEPRRPQSSKVATSPEAAQWSPAPPDFFCARRCPLGGAVSRLREAPLDGAYFAAAVPSRVAGRKSPSRLGPLELSAAVRDCHVSDKARQLRGFANVTGQAGADAKTEGQGHARVGRGRLVSTCERRVRRGTRRYIDSKYGNEPPSLFG